jgi:hypothetical protein
MAAARARCPPFSGFARRAFVPIFDRIIFILSVLSGREAGYPFARVSLYQRYWRTSRGKPQTGPRPLRRKELAIAG